MRRASATKVEGSRPPVHQGIPSASFKRSFNLADHVKVVGANAEHGLLTIDLVREVPEQLMPRRIDVSSGADTRVAKPHDQKKQIDVNAKKVTSESYKTVIPPPGPQPGGLVAQNGDERELFTIRPSRPRSPAPVNS